ncbi:Xaa-Pro aminopeptidase [Cutibacterium acnes JCM 18920]|nr:Xaa-Pro aminopeptidase [Cutibacterium acnes JCM 18920]
MTETRSTELNEQLKQAEKQKVPKRQTPFSKAFVEFIPTDWAPIPTSCPNRSARYLRLPHTVMP